jgi:hypothetical protein
MIKKRGFMKKLSKRFLVIVLICVIAGVGFAAGPDTIVYVTKTGEKYHTEQCSSLKKSKIAISLGRAVIKYQPCKQCNPPVLDK